jgi:hypothetical protein
MKKALFTVIQGNTFTDYDFWHKVVKHGGRVGIAKGIYLFHIYRAGKSVKDKTHLI